MPREKKIRLLKRKKLSFAQRKVKLKSRKCGKH